MKNRTGVMILLPMMFLIACTGSRIWNDPDAALRNAGETGKPLVLIFSDRENCYACGKLDRQILNSAAWKDYSEDRFTVCITSLPERGKNPEDRARRTQLVSRFGVNRLPFILLYDRENRPFAVTGFIKGGPTAFIAHIRALHKQRTPVLKRLFTTLWSGNEETDRTATTLLDNLESWKVVRYYPALLERISGRKNVFSDKTRLRAAVMLYKTSTSVKTRDRARKAMNTIRTLDRDTADRLALRTRMDEIEAKYFPRYKWKEALDTLASLVGKARGNNLTHLHYLEGRCLYQLSRFRESAAAFRRADSMAATDNQKRRIIRQWLRSAEFQARKSSPGGI